MNDLYKAVCLVAICRRSPDEKRAEYIETGASKDLRTTLSSVVCGGYDEEGRVAGGG